MAPPPCATCETNRAVILRPKNHQRLCKPCFISIFELETHHTITSHNLFQTGERVAIGASGGKDSTVLASVLKTLNDRYDYGLDLVLLSIDEGIKGYRDDSLQTVKRNARDYDLPLTILGYDELYGWTMDQVVEQVGKKGNCTYCGVFRRQALDRGAARLGVDHVVTGHNADDVAETVLMNLLRGDLPRLARTASIVTSTPSAAAAATISSSSNTSPTSVAGHAMTNIKRSKPLKYAYEKEIVLYAHHKKLDYFSTECIYSPEAFRGSARALVKNLERIRPSAILDIVRSGEDMAKLVPGQGGAQECSGSCSSGTKADVVPTVVVADDDEGEGGCGSAKGSGGSSGEMAVMERELRQNESAADQSLEVEITANGSRKNGDESREIIAVKSDKPSNKHKTKGPHNATPRKNAKRTLGQCSRCGYMSSQAICKACDLLEGLNKNRPKTAVGIAFESENGKSDDITKAVNGIRHIDLG